MNYSVKMKPIKTDDLAQLFLELWQMEESGVPSIEAIAILKNQMGVFKPQLTQLYQRIKSGKSIADSGFKIGLFNETQKVLIYAGESSGCLSAVYKELADHYGEKSKRERKIKSKLYLPAATLLLAFFIEPIPALFNAQISAFDYLQITLGRFLLIALTIFLLIRLPFWLTDGFLRGFKRPFHVLQLQTPLVRDWIIKRQLNEFLAVLALMLEAGLAFSEAFPKAVATIKNTTLREAFAFAQTMVNQGNSVSEVLEQVTVFDSNTLQMIYSAEHSGKLASTLSRLAKLEAETIYLQNEMLVEWLPRLAYTLVAIWMAFSIVQNSLARLANLPI